MESYSEEHCVVLSRSKIIRNVVAEMLEGEGVCSLVSDSFGDIPYFIVAEGVPQHLFVDIDGFGGIAVIYDQLRKIRETLPSTSIVLLSSDFETDDFGTHRIMLADVSVRLPLTYSNLQLALIQGPFNNEVWNRRRMEIENYRNGSNPDRTTIKLIRSNA